MLQMLISPDLQTRESRMLAGGRAQFSVTSAKSGKTVYVRVDCKHKHPDTGKYGRVPLDEATHVFITEKGYGTARVGTYYPPKGNFKVGRFFTDMPDNAPHVWAVQQIIEFVNTGSHSPMCTIEVESRCGMCGRKLEDPVSIQRGIGPECAGKPTGTRILHAFVPTNEPQQPLVPENRGAHSQDQAIVQDANAQWAAHKNAFAQAEAVQEQQAQIQKDLDRGDISPGDAFAAEMDLLNSASRKHVFAQPKLHFPPTGLE